jgi:pimeloyl-ACP methyl ester carboxylesterase
MEKPIKIPAGNLELAGSLQSPRIKGKHSVPLIIICHGFIGSRIGVDRLFVQAAREFASKGYAVLRFDYGGCGESPGNYGAQQFEDLIEQTVHVIHYTEKLKGIEPDQIILIGHSLGGAVATHTASFDKRVARLVLWSSVAYPFQDIVRIVGERTYRQAKEKQYADFRGYRFTSSFFESMTNYFPLKDIRHFTGDVLVIHGSSDEMVPSKYCFYYQKAALFREKGTADKEIIIGADHTYSHARHKEQLFASTVKWLAGGGRITETDRVPDYPLGL